MAIKSFPLRIDNKLYDALKEEADRNRRKIVEQLRLILEQRYRKVIGNAKRNRPA